MAICALFVWGGNLAWGQASFNHTYTVGVEPAAGGDYFLYNIGAKQFLTSGLNYGTRATVDNSGRVLTLSVNGIGYNIRTDFVSLNNREEGDRKAGYLTTNGYVDTGTSDAAWQFTPVELAGYTNVYTIKNSDSQYLFFDAANEDPGCPVNVGASTGDNYSYWLLISKAAREAVGDYTHYLINTQMNAAWEFKTWSGSRVWNDYAIIQPGGNVKNRCGEKYHAAVDIYQNIKESVPNGRYKFFAQGFWRQDGTAAGPVLYANSNKKTLLTKTGPEDNMTDASNSFSEGNYVNDVETFVSDGNLKVGINITDGSQWVIFDNFVLDYLGQLVMDYAEELPAGGAMAADTWYYLDIAVAGDNYNATATDLSKIICTTDGYTLTTATTGGVTLVAENNSLSVTRYYVKSVGAANNLVVAPASYTYTVGSATADKTYIQPGNTVTVSYQDLVTSNPGAVLTKDFSGVTFDGDAITVTPTSNGFSFEVPSGLAVGTAFTLAIPANAIGYAVGSTYNEAQNITLTTPAIYDGIYYFYNNYTQKYLSRGRNWGTQALMDDYGVPAFLEFDGEGKTRVKFFDNYKYLSSDGWLFADNATGGQFYVEKVVGGYKIKDAAINKYVAVYDDYAVGDALESDNSSNWALETPAEYVAKDNATTLANAQAVAAATSAGIIGITSFADLESELSSNYGETSIAITGAKAEKYNVNAGSNPLVESKYVEETVNGLKPGLYRLTVDAFQRASSNQRVAEAGGANSLVYVYAGSAKTQIKSVMAYGANAAYSSDFEYNGLHYPNNEASAYTALATGNYKNVVYVYVVDEGEGTGSLTFGINNPQNTNAGGYPNALWAVYDNFTLSYFEAKASASEKTALSDAIAAAEAKTLGFEDGEYAPYNNVDALTKLAAAKAINPEAASGSSVVAATTALTGATWTDNAGEVNAVHNANFATSEDLGWSFSAWGQFVSGLNTNTNASNGTARSSNAGTLTYGNKTGYTMPLKASTVYRLTFKVASWDDGNKNTGTDISVLNSSSEGLATKSFDASGTNRDRYGAFKTYTAVFTTGDAGNYTLVITAKGGRSVYTDIELKKAVADVVSINEGVDYTPAASDYADVTLTRTLSNTNWNTFVVPFDIDNATLTAKFGTVEVAEYAEASADAQNATVSFTKMATPAITANTPVLLKTSTAPASVTFNGVQVKTGEAKVAGTNFDFVGSYDASKFVKTGDYYIYQNKIYKSAKDDGTFIKGTRAYIEAKTTGARIVDFTIDGVTSGIRDLNADLSESEGVVYNLNGQKVQSVKNGVFVKNGKKVVVK